MSRLGWLTARPLAHRGLHDAKAGVIENTPTSIRAAIDNGYGIELDLQITADGEAVVHHDDELGRLTEGSGRIADMTVAALKAVPFKATGDRLITLRELCALVAGRAVMALELKSRFDGDLRLAAHAAQVLSAYSGPVAVMSFDPDLIEAIRKFAPALTRGIIAERHYDWGKFPPATKRRLAFLLHANRTRPQFIAYAVHDLPALAPLIARNIFGIPLLTWTVRSDQDRAVAARYADQIIFEQTQS
ncbi:MAG TPA: glycerophosphodiester phosphodiesterase family protein [Pseudolabrys sp.]|nr:glycerophosphodiester phosphodiesterase family protein [Pseudolabrys sp.]